MSTYYRPRFNLQVHDIESISELEIHDREVMENGVEHFRVFCPESEDHLWFEASKGSVIDIFRYGINKVGEIFSFLGGEFASEYDDDYMELGAEKTNVFTIQFPIEAGVPTEE